MVYLPTYNQHKNQANSIVGCINHTWILWVREIHSQIFSGIFCPEKGLGAKRRNSTTGAAIESEAVVFHDGFLTGGKRCYNVRGLGVPHPGFQSPPGWHSIFSRESRTKSSSLVGNPYNSHKWRFTSGFPILKWNNPVVTFCILDCILGGG